MVNQKRYIPALRFHRLTPVYDFVLSRLMGEADFKRRLIEQAGIQPGMQVLDLGCGTGTLTIMVKQAHPDAIVTGLDGDPTVLDIARRKAADQGVDICFDQGMADKIQHPARSYHRVLSSLVIHHLDTQQKQTAFMEIYRVLAIGGEFHLLDFGRPFSPYGKLASQFMVHFEEVSDNIRGALPEMIQAAGFSNLQETYRFSTLFGDIRVNKAVV